MSPCGHACLIHSGQPRTDMVWAGVPTFAPMDAHTFGDHPVIDYLVLPAVAVRDGLAPRARAVLSRGDDGVPRTRLRGDDQAAAPFQMSRHITRPLAAATLTLDSILTGFEPQDGRYPALTRDYGMFPLIRSAMLHAARAVYLLQPPERADRVRRLLALAHEDAARILQAQESMGACTCDTHLIDRAADLVAEDKQLVDAWIASDTVVMAEAAAVSTFGPPLFSLYEAVDCASRGLMEPFHSFVVSPLLLATPWGDKQFVVTLHETHWVSLAALADLVSIGWNLADLEEDADAAAA